MWHWQHMNCHLSYYIWVHAWLHKLVSPLKLAEKNFFWPQVFFRSLYPLIFGARWDKEFWRGCGDEMIALGSRHFSKSETDIRSFQLGIILVQILGGIFMGSMHQLSFKFYNLELSLLLISKHTLLLKKKSCHASFCSMPKPKFQQAHQAHHTSCNLLNWRKWYST